MKNEKKTKKQICWICQQPGKQNKRFQPCYCKGSLSFVHRNCLNTWATTQYELKSNNYKQEIECPNCKCDYVYQIKETYKLKNLSKISFFDSTEKVTLILLTICQIIVSAFDFFSIFGESQSENDNQISLLNWVHMVHFGTVIILLCAASYNIFDMVMKQVELEILDRQY